MVGLLSKWSVEREMEYRFPVLVDASLLFLLTA
jgi:hypothetical protein